MKILVTVGTTRFDTLIRFIDQTLEGSLIEFTFQISDGNYKPVNFPYFSFSDDIETYYRESDLVICHAGAGTIFKLLEIRKKVIIVPNTERIDNHQLDIANFMERNGYAITIRDFKLLPIAIEGISKITLKPFEKHDFDKAEEIVSFIMGKT